MPQILRYQTAAADQTVANAYVAVHARGDAVIPSTYEELTAYFVAIQLASSVVNRECHFARAVFQRDIPRLVPTKGCVH
jgi:hypothetical protein